MSQITGTPLLRTLVRSEADIVMARQRTRNLSQLLGFDNQDQARLATAVSELTRNVFQYVGSGNIEFLFDDGDPQALIIRVSDSGGGISFLNDILDGSYVSSSGMGVGLAGTKKLMDAFEVETSPSGTIVTIAKNLSRRAKKISKKEIANVVEQLVSQRSQNPFEEMQNQNRDLLSALQEVNAAKEELHELNRELAETNRGVVALYAELDEKAASLTRANEVKTKFLSNMTHEFRTPLSSIISLTRILLNRIDGDLNSEQEKQVNYIRQSSEGLLELVNDLLDLAKVEAGKVSINVNEFHVAEVLSGLRGVFRPLLSSNKSVDFTVDEAIGFDLMETDQAKIAQILRNLVSNAVKFTESGYISIKARLISDDFVVFSVTDSGIGVAPEHLKMIFEDFSQVDSQIQKLSKGTGLGLPLSRKLSRLLGGDLWVESTLGKGSTFHVKIPRKYNGDGEGVLISQEPPSKPVNTSSNDCDGKFKFLIIDDDEPSRYVLKNLLNQEVDANYFEVNNGLAGLILLRENKPDAVFLDLVMPELDGFEVLKQIRSDVMLNDLPVIINTSKKLSREELELLNQRATCVLSKDRVDHHESVVELKSALVKAGFSYEKR